MFPSNDQWEVVVASDNHPTAAPWEVIQISPAMYFPQNNNTSIVFYLVLTGIHQVVLDNYQETVGGTGRFSVHYHNILRAGNVMGRSYRNVVNNRADGEYQPFLEFGDIMTAVIPHFTAGGTGMFFDRLTGKIV